MAFQETKNSLLSELSPQLRKKPGRKIDTWGLSLAPKDDDVTLSPQALIGVDLWMEQQLERAFFLSDRLVQILKEEKLTRRLGLRRCLIASDALN